MKKEYFRIQLDVTFLCDEDVISTSGYDDIAPDNNQHNPFDGSYDDMGWT